MFKLKIESKTWSWIGRILPLTGLLALILFIKVDIQNWIDYLLILMAIVFGTIAFFWWWWVIDAIRNLNRFFTESLVRFTDMQPNLRQIKQDISKVKTGHAEELKLIRETKTKATILRKGK